jgi:hypothetical protein
MGTVASDETESVTDTVPEIGDRGFDDLGDEDIAIPAGGAGWSRTRGPEKHVFGGLSGALVWYFLHACIKNMNGSFLWIVSLCC